MNCFEFKKFSMSDPYSEEQAFLQHKEDCIECRNYLNGILAFDTKLAQAASVSRAPDDFKARLKLRHVIQQQEVRHQRFRWMSYAAGVMLATAAVFFGVQNHQTGKDFNNLYNEVVNHIEFEPQSLTTVQATAQARMQSHLASYAGFKDVEELSGLRYSQLCPIGKHKTWHAVMDHGHGLVTVIYFKGDQMPERSGAEKNDYVKIIKRESGSVMLLGNSQKAVDTAEQELNQSITI